MSMSAAFSFQRAAEVTSDFLSPPAAPQRPSSIDIVYDLLRNCSSVRDFALACQMLTCVFLSHGTETWSWRVGNGVSGSGSGIQSSGQGMPGDELNLLIDLVEFTARTFRFRILHSSLDLYLASVSATSSQDEHDNVPLNSASAPAVETPAGFQEFVTLLDVAKTHVEARADMVMIWKMHLIESSIYTPEMDQSTNSNSPSTVPSQPLQRIEPLTMHLPHSSHANSEKISIKPNFDQIISERNNKSLASSIQQYVNHSFSAAETEAFFNTLSTEELREALDLIANAVNSNISVAMSSPVPWVHSSQQSQSTQYTNESQHANVGDQRCSPPIGTLAERRGFPARALSLPGRTIPRLTTAQTSSNTQSSASIPRYASSAPTSAPRTQATSITSFPASRESASSTLTSFFPSHATPQTTKCALGNPTRHIESNAVCAEINPTSNDLPAGFGELTNMMDPSELLDPAFVNDIERFFQDALSDAALFDGTNTSFPAPSADHTYQVASPAAPCPTYPQSTLSTVISPRPDSASSIRLSLSPSSRPIIAMQTTDRDKEKDSKPLGDRDETVPPICNSRSSKLAEDLSSVHEREDSLSAGGREKKRAPIRTSSVSGWDGEPLRTRVGSPMAGSMVSRGTMDSGAEMGTEEESPGNDAFVCTGLGLGALPTDATPVVTQQPGQTPYHPPHVPCVQSSYTDSFFPALPPTLSAQGPRTPSTQTPPVDSSSVSSSGADLDVGAHTSLSTTLGKRQREDSPLFTPELGGHRTLPSPFVPQPPAQSRASMEVLMSESDPPAHLSLPASRCLEETEEDTGLGSPALAVLQASHSINLEKISSVTTFISGNSFNMKPTTPSLEALKQRAPWHDIGFFSEPMADDEDNQKTQCTTAPMAGPGPGDHVDSRNTMTARHGGDEENIAMKV